MRGHEYARTAISDHLIARVPARLAAIREDLLVADPADPAAYLLADALPIDASKYPIVIVQSTSLLAMRATEAGARGTWICDYAVTIAVACRSGTAGAYEDASLQRDRLLLAVRESLLANRELTPVAAALTQTITEEIGDAAQDVQSRPLAAGTLTVTVRVAESLADDIATVTTTAIDIDPVTTDPTAVIDPTQLPD